MSDESDEITETVEDWDPLPLDPQPDVWEPVPPPEPTRVRRGPEHKEPQESIDRTAKPIDVWERIRIDWRKVKNKWLRNR